jgi:hypothetical protein
MVETTLELEGLPYWWNLSDPSRILSEEFFGKHPGLGDEYEVTDGAFADWPITSNFDINDWGAYIVNMSDNQFVGNENGYLRSDINPLANPFYVAYPYVNPDGEVNTYPGWDWESAKSCLETPYRMIHPPLPSSTLPTASTMSVTATSLPRCIPEPT